MSVRLFLCLAVLAAVLFASRRARACTGVYVGKKVSRDGGTIIARTLDLYPLTTLMRKQAVPAVRGKPGRVLKGIDGFSWPLPENTYAYVCTPAVSSDGRGRYASAAVNEKGLAVTGTVTAWINPQARQMDPPADDGLCEEVIPDLIASCCRTAREGVELIARVMEKIGSAEQNIILLADPGEAWYVETYTRKNWAALRLPEDRAAVFGNEFMLEGHAPGEEGFLCSPGLFDMPMRAGIACFDARGRMDLFRTYAGSFSDFANGRTWWGRCAFAPTQAGEYRTDRKFPLRFRPEGKIGPKDVMELFRSRFEGTPYCPEETGRKDWRVLGSESTCTSHVLCVYEGLPEEASAVGWFSLANAEHSVYLPLSALVTELDPAFSRDQSAAEGRHYDPALASVRFKRLCALCEQDRAMYGAGVRALFSRLEVEWIAQAGEVNLQAAKSLNRGDPAGARRLWTEFAQKTEKTALAQADRMWEELIWYMMDHTDSINYDYRWRTMEQTPRVQKPYEP